jgi:hypothetical protein
VRVRYLQLCLREADGWEEGLERQLDLSAAFEELPMDCPLDAEAGPGRAALSGRVHLEAEPAGDLARLRLRVENRTPGGFDTRAEAVRSSFVGVHALLGVQGGQLLSLADPPPEAAAAAAACRNLNTWPALLAPDLALSSPIILPDHPQVAPESAGELFDSTEIDELLTLRVRTLTEGEKDQACRTDERARRLVERCDELAAEGLERLHGALRRLEPATVQLGAGRVAPGVSVRLAPRRRADAQDMFLAGRTARVQGVKRDVDGQTWLAVRLEDEPDYGRYYHFHPEEVELL